jgi:hypothetical protein
MYLIQILVPLYDNQGDAFARAALDRVRDELAGRFGGVTAHLRSPARGVWKEDGGAEAHDDVVTFEVMVERLDRAWWAEYRRELEQRFQQEEMVVRALPFERI